MTWRETRRGEELMEICSKDKKEREKRAARYFMSNGFVSAPPPSFIKTALREVTLTLAAIWRSLPWVK